VWKAKVAAGWVPYRDGQWLWYDELGYTWIANEPWGWLPFHYGRWCVEQGGIGWVWSPGKSSEFKPGEVYWLRETNLVGWGPLAPGEAWDAKSVPKSYTRANTSLAHWQQDARELLPATADENLEATKAVFVIAPPSPAVDNARRGMVRPALRAGSTRVVPILPGVTYTRSGPPPELAAVPDNPPVPPQLPVPPSPANATLVQPLQPSPPVQEPAEVYYPAPVYTGIIVVNPPEIEVGHPRHRVPGSAPPPRDPDPRPPPVYPSEPPTHLPEPTRPEPIKPDSGSPKGEARFSGDSDKSASEATKRNN
jgi:hypothetical protein